MFEFFKNLFRPKYQLPKGDHLHCSLAVVNKYVECTKCASRVSKSSGIAPNCNLPRWPRGVETRSSSRGMMPRRVGHMPPKPLPVNKKRGDDDDTYLVPMNFFVPVSTDSPDDDDDKPAFVSGKGGNFGGGGASASWDNPPEMTRTEQYISPAPTPAPSSYTTDWASNNAPPPAPAPYDPPSPSPSPPPSYDSPSPSPSYDSPSPSPSPDF